MSNSPKVSIIIPTYNRGKLIGRTIKSVLNQTYTNYEILIIDDASNDNTHEVVAGFLDNRINYTRLESNTEGTMPRNVGIEKSEGEFIAFLDSDDEWLPNKLEEQLNFILEYKNKDDNFLCFTGLIKKRMNQEINLDQRHMKDKEDILEYIIIGGNDVQTSTYLLPTNLAKKIKFDSELKKHQDWDFCLRLQKENVSFIYLPKKLTIWYIVHEEYQISNNDKYNLSIDWYEKSKLFMTLKAQYSFLAYYMAENYIADNHRLRALRIYYKALSLGVFRKRDFVRGLLKALTPSIVWKYISLKNLSKFVIGSAKKIFAKI